jgi:hypothetical protein
VTPLAVEWYSPFSGRELLLSARRAARWVRVVAALILALSLANALYIENQLSHKRDEITHMFNH